MAVKNKMIKPDDQPKADRSSALEDFWSTFRLSPKLFEHHLLTDMRWLALAALGPFITMTILQVAYYLIWLGSEISNYVAVVDPFLTFIATSLLLAAITYRYFWYPSIGRTFLSLYQNSVLYDPSGARVNEADYIEYLGAYRRYLHSPRRYILPVSFALLFVLILLFLSGSFIRSTGGNPALIVIVFLYLCMPLIWAMVGGLGLWSVVATTKAILDLTPRFTINIQPLHSDKTGGLKLLGDLCSQIGIMVLVIIIPLLFYVQDSLKNTQTAIFTSVVSIICIIVAFTFWIVIKPLWDIHESMVTYKQKREYELNEKTRVLYEKFNDLIKLDKLEDADNIKKRIKILTDEIEVVQKYPQWPISYLPVLRSFIASGVLSSLVSYLALILNVTTSEGLKSFLALIQSVFSS